MNSILMAAEITACTRCTNKDYKPYLSRHSPHNAAQIVIQSAQRHIGPEHVNPDVLGANAFSFTASPGGLVFVFS